MTELGISDRFESEHDQPVDSTPSSVVPAYSSRREMRTAGGYDQRPRPRQRPRPQRRRPSVRKRLSRAGVMLVIGGLFAALAFPAYADQAQKSGDETEPLDAQTLVLESAAVDAGVDVGALRDTYGSTSAADLRRLYADAIRQSNLEAYLASGAKELGDDYPWFAELTRYQGGGLSPLNYYYRECVDFVAWRLNRDAGSTSAPFLMTWNFLTPNGGDARAWKFNWINRGWPTGTEPQVGAVAWFPGANHVGYVAGIMEDGSVLIEEYNGSIHHAYSQRVILPSQAFYLYAPPHP